MKRAVAGAGGLLGPIHAKVGSFCREHVEKGTVEKGSVHFSDEMEFMP